MSDPGPRDHHWRCDCKGGHFLSLQWDAGEDCAEVWGELAVEGDFWRSLWSRLAIAWRVLTDGHSETRVGLALNARTAREVAAALVDFSDTAGGARKLKLSDLRTAAEIHERDMQDPEYRREWERISEQGDD